MVGVGVGAFTVAIHSRLHVYSGAPGASGRKHQQYEHPKRVDEFGLCQ